MVAEGTRRVVVLAVNVRPDSATNGHLTGARQHRNPQTVGEGGFHQLVEGDAAFYINNGGFWVNGVDAVKWLHIHHQATGVLGAVAVGTAHATCDDAAAKVFRFGIVLLCNKANRLADGLQVRGGKNLGCGGGGAAPTGQRFGFCVEGSEGTARSNGAGRALIARHRFTRLLPISMLSLELHAHVCFQTFRLG